MAATAVFNFIGAWNEFFFAIILGNNQIKTVTVEILTYVTDYAILFGRLFAAAGLILLPIIIFYLLRTEIYRDRLDGRRVERLNLCDWDSDLAG